LGGKEGKGRVFPTTQEIFCTAKPHRYPAREDKNAGKQTLSEREILVRIRGFNGADRRSLLAQMGFQLAT
jgi:hypothetical protein